MLLSVENLHKSYPGPEGPVAVLRGVSLTLDRGESLALTGESGSGKSTLLHLVAGLDHADGGRVLLDGEDLAALDEAGRARLRRQRIGIVFQQFNLIPSLDVAANIRFQARLKGNDDRDRFARLAEALGLSAHLGKYPEQLSGGQQQRVAVARALARRPQALLLDEPFSAVDRATREKLYAEIIALRAHLKMPVVLVTHDVNEAQLLADRMVVIEKGLVVREGTTAEVMADPRALGALGIREVAAMLPATVAEHLPDGLTRLDAATGPLFLPTVEGAPGTRLRVRIMAHEVILSRARPEGLSAQNILAGTVARIVPGAGPGVMVHVAVGDHEILARITRRAAEQLGLQIGDTVHAILKSMSVAHDHVARATDQEKSAG